MIYNLDKYYTGTTAPNFETITGLTPLSNFSDPTYSSLISSIEGEKNA
jgi:hypothetical protein